MGNSSHQVFGDMFLLLSSLFSANPMLLLHEYLGGAFNDFIFSTLLGEDFQVD